MCTSYSTNTTMQPNLERDDTKLREDVVTLTGHILEAQRRPLGNLPTLRYSTVLYSMSEQSRLRSVHYYVYNSQVDVYSVGVGDCDGWTTLDKGHPRQWVTEQRGWQ